MSQPRTSVSSSSKNWRTQQEEKLLVSQVSSVLVQRRNWVPIIRTLRLATKLTADSFFQILIKIRRHPQVSLSFFHWVVTNISFKADFRSHCHLFHLALGSGLKQPANAILNSLVQDSYSALSISNAIFRANIRDKLPNFTALDYLIEFYLHQGLVFEGLEVFSMMRHNGITPALHACNLLMDAVYRKKGVSFALCCFSSMTRGGLLPDNATWSLISEIWYDHRKLHMLEKLLDSGIQNNALYARVIEGLCKIGNLEAALGRLTEMQGRNLEPDLDILTSLLEGACRYENTEMISCVTCLIEQKGFIPMGQLIESDMIIQKLCDLNRVSAAMMLYKRASDLKIVLHELTYKRLLEAVSKDRRVSEAIGLYRAIVEKRTAMKNDDLIAFADLLCLSHSCDERFEVLEDIIENGVRPGKSSLVIFISSLCCSRRWREVEQWLNVFIDKNMLPDSVSLKPLFKHYSSQGEIGKALELHKKMEHLKSGLDIDTYNVTLEGLFKEQKVDDAVCLFNYMIEMEKLDSRSFITIIRGLHSAKKRRKAMEFHDQMVKNGMKPDKTAYRRLIVLLTSSRVENS